MQLVIRIAFNERHAPQIALKALWDFWNANLITNVCGSACLYTSLAFVWEAKRTIQILLSVKWPKGIVKEPLLVSAPIKLYNTVH